MNEGRSEVILAVKFRIERAYELGAADVGRFNLAVFGPSGVGKSTLINAVFGYEVAETGVGEPVTQGSRLYFHDDRRFGLLDTRGIELGDSFDEILDDLRSLVDRQRGRPVEDQIHVAWYCISGTGRLQRTDERFVKELRKLGIPVVFVLTRVPNSNGEPEEVSLELATVICESHLDIASSAPVLTNALGDEWLRDAAFGLDQLIHVTRQSAPEGIQAAFDASQQRDQRLKEEAVSRALGAARRAIQDHESDEQWVLSVWARLLADVSIAYGLGRATSIHALTRAVEDVSEQGILRFVTPSKWRQLLENPVVAAGAWGIVVLGVPVMMWNRKQRERKRQQRRAVEVFTELLAFSWQASCITYAAKRSSSRITDSREAEEQLVQDFVDRISRAAQQFIDTQGNQE